MVRDWFVSLTNSHQRKIPTTYYIVQVAVSFRLWLVSEANLWLVRVSVTSQEIPLGVKNIGFYEE